MKLVFATNNRNKIKEVQQMLPSSIQLVSLEEIGCFEDIPETADTIEGNAILKAQYIHQKYKMDVFADDTGLEVSELNGEPGVLSARYAGDQKDDKQNIALLLKNMEGKPNREARFKTIFALIFQGEMHLFEGIANGKITHKVLGINGFGYDPIFQPDGFEQTFAELSPEQKNEISHRKKATQKLVNFLKSK